MRSVENKAVLSVKPMVFALALAGAASLPAGAWAQVPFEIEGIVTAIAPGPNGTANITMFGQVFNVPSTAYIHTPTKSLTIDELLDSTPLPGRSELGFVGGTGILVGTVANPGPGATAIVEDIVIEPGETVLLGAITANDGGVIRIMGVPLVDLDDPRMPSSGLVNEFGFPVIPTTVPVSGQGVAEGYFAQDDGRFHHFRAEVEGGELVDPASAATSILRARCSPGGRLEVLGGSYNPPNATIRVYNNKTGFSFGTVQTTVDPLTPTFGSYRFRVDVGEGATDTSGNCPSEVRAINESTGAQAVSIVAGVTVPPPPPPTNLPPVAVDDVAGTTAGLAVTVDLTENDTDPNNNLDVTTVAIVDNAGLAILFPTPRNGSITMTPEQAGTYLIKYTVGDTLGEVSNEATLQLVVQPAPVVDIITIDRVNYRQGRDRWDVRGTTDIANAEVTLTLERTGQVIGTALADGFGFWLFDVRNAGIFPESNDSVRVTSEHGGTVVAPITFAP